MTTLHLGDCKNGCAECAKNCDCQDCRINRTWEDSDAKEMDFEDFLSIFEDRDPSEFI